MTDVSFVDAQMPPERRNRYDWHSLKIGGPAMFVANAYVPEFRKTVRAAAMRNGMKLVCRPLTVDGVPGAGVWRTG